MLTMMGIRGEGAFEVKGRRIYARQEAIKAMAAAAVVVI